MRCKSTWKKPLVSNMSFLPNKIITITSDHSERTFLSQTSSEDTPPPDKETNKILRRFCTRPELPANLPSDYTNSKYFIHWFCKSEQFQGLRICADQKACSNESVSSSFTLHEPEPFEKISEIPKQINPNKFKSCMKKFRLNLIKERAWTHPKSCLLFAHRLAAELMAKVFGTPEHCMYIPIHIFQIIYRKEDTTWIMVHGNALLQPTCLCWQSEEEHWI